MLNQVFEENSASKKSSSNAWINATALKFDGKRRSPNMFLGKVRSVFQCKNCNGSAQNSQFFQDLSLQFPLVPQALDPKPRTGKSPDREAPLIDLVRFHFRDEVIKDYLCPQCKTKSEVVRSQCIERTPTILTVMLHRLDSPGLPSKIKTQVGFPLTGLDLSAFVTDQTQHSRFNLIGMISHLGNSRKGHFVAYCFDKRVEAWVEFNDLRARIVGSDCLASKVGKDVYLLFFEKSPI